MGRIADALKKAEQHRGTNSRVSSSGHAGLFHTDGPGTFRAATDEGLRKGPDHQAQPVSARRDSIRNPQSAIHNPLADPGSPQAWDVDPSLVCVRERSSSTMEQYRAVRTWLMRRAGASGRLCLAVTSSLPREGKSVTTANLAATFAELKHLQVLAVDADLRQTSMAGLYGMDPSPGLAEVLTGRAKLNEAIKQTPLGNLSLLPAGMTKGLNPSELLSSMAASRVFEEIRERFHLVLVDTPPVQRLSDVGVIAGYCSGVLMVVRMHKTPAHIVRQSVSWLQSNHLSIVGCIAAGCSLSASRYDDHTIADHAA
jgi:capsular exopolysaccharide synthesis family protein